MELIFNDIRSEKFDSLERREMFRFFNNPPIQFNENIRRCSKDHFILTQLAREMFFVPIGKNQDFSVNFEFRFTEMIDGVSKRIKNSRNFKREFPLFKRKVKTLEPHVLYSFLFIDDENFLWVKNQFELEIPLMKSWGSQFRLKETNAARKFYHDLIFL